MITGKSIGEYTKAMLEDYKELTGTDIAPSPEAYILFRNQALLEIKEGSVLGNAPEKRTERKNTSAGSLAKSIPHTEIKKVPAAVPEKDSREEDVPSAYQEDVSGFDLLKNLKDPWN